MEESRIENYLKRQVDKIGGRAYKWNPTGVIGLPDRMVLLPGGKVIFVELNAPGKKLEKFKNIGLESLENLDFKLNV